MIAMIIKHILLVIVQKMENTFHLEQQTTEGLVTTHPVGDAKQSTDPLELGQK